MAVNLPNKISFPTEEEKILKLWDELDAFRTSLKMSEGKPEYTFYDGPPFATGLPHYGHILAGTIKDIVTRYAHQTGHHVSRRFGWDCHGLPVEYEIDKKLGITGRDQVMDMGIKAYNAECRGIVTRYCGEWETVVRRLGRWIDFRNDYKTMEPWYMESVWWVFKEMFSKDLVYRGFKVMPYSTACNTPLSNFESNLNYKDVNDPAVIVSFPLLDEPGVSMLAWTTTPWTLPSNLALCVNPTMTYVRLQDSKTGATWIVAESRLVALYPKYGKKKYAGGEFEILSKCTGAELGGKRYTPLFQFFADTAATEDGVANAAGVFQGSGSFRVLVDSYVTEDSGTGVVHCAPAFGEDDYRVCLQGGIITKGGALPCPVDANGRFTDEVPDFVGTPVKEADAAILAALKSSGRLVNKGTIKHSYPFCWRSETPLIYKAVPSWFVKVESIKERLLANNAETYWVPTFVKEKRFHNWLADARDWAISRNRYWGTPLPIWISEDGEEIVVVGSIAELEELSGETVTDLHRDSIDHLTIPSKQGKGTLRRVDEVFDCWFESGSMPYAQSHYPFENAEKFQTGFPADFIAEGLDQTRGWFYTLMVISTALFDKPAFKNLVVNGLVLAEDGKKMSKRLKNYPDPTLVVNSYGADALRLYLINSPVVRAEPLKFTEAGVLGVVKEVFLPWYNAFRFLVQSVSRYNNGPDTPFVPSSAQARGSSNVMDQWILASAQTLIKFVREEMAAYRLYTVVPRLLTFVEQLTNWYLRLNRRRLKAGGDDTAAALCVLFDVFLSLCRLMAPFTPFFAEFLFQRLRALAGHAAPTPIHAPQAEDAAAAADGETKGEGDGVIAEDEGNASIAAAAAAANALVEAASEDDLVALTAVPSVHYLSVPEFSAERLDAGIESRVAVLQQVIELGRVARERRNVSLKMPVAEVIVVHRDPQVLAAVEALSSYVDTELNTRTLTVTADEQLWCTLRAEANARLLGKRLGRESKAVRAAVAKLSHTQIVQFETEGSMEVCGHSITAAEVQVLRSFKGDAQQYEAGVSAEGDLMVVVDVSSNESLVSEWLAREVVNRVQKLRKSSGLDVEDKVDVLYRVLGPTRPAVPLTKPPLDLPADLPDMAAIQIAVDDAQALADQEAAAGGAAAAAAATTAAAAAAAETKQGEAAAAAGAGTGKGKGKKGGKGKGGKGKGKKGKGKGKKGGESKSNATEAAAAAAPAVVDEAAPARLTLAVESQATLLQTLLGAAVLPLSAVALPAAAAAPEPAAAAAGAAAAAEEKGDAAAATAAAADAAPAVEGVVLGREVTSVNGADLEVTLLRVGVLFPSDDAPLQALLGDAAAVTAAHVKALLRTVEPSSFPAYGQPLELAIGATRLAVVRGTHYFVGGADKLRATAAAAE